jgi:hypothetical protein
MHTIMVIKQWRMRLTEQVARLDEVTVMYKMLLYSSSAIVREDDAKFDVYETLLA